MSDYDKKTHLEEPKYDEGVELPAGFSSWDEVLEDSFSPLSEKEIEAFLKALTAT